MEISTHYHKLNSGKVIKLEFPFDVTSVLHDIVGGEYDLRVVFNQNPIIIDIGANVGLFSVWATDRWQPKEVYCYEPLTENYNFLTKNIEKMANLLGNEGPHYHTYKQAVEAPSKRLYKGKINLAQSSFNILSVCTDEYEEVESIKADDLPACNILKIDAEGCEGMILPKYLATHAPPEVIMFEYHFDDDRKELDRILYHYEYILVGGKVIMYEQGILKYIFKGSVTQVEERICP